MAGNCHEVFSSSIISVKLSMTSQYERLRLQNLADNRRILAEIGLINPVSKL